MRRSFSVVAVNRRLGKDLGRDQGRKAHVPHAAERVLSRVDGAVKANILVTEPLGGDGLVDCALGESKVLVKTKPDFAGVRGEECWLTFDTTRWHLFAPETGLAFF